MLLGDVVECVREYFSFSAPTIRARLDDLSERLDSVAQKVDQLVDNIATIDRRTSSYSTCSSSTDGSNLAVYTKPRLNNKTQVQYVTGRSARYNTRKRLYDNINMDKVVDMKCKEPRKKIRRINQQLENEGIAVTRISDNSLIIDEPSASVNSIVDKECIEETNYTSS